MQKDSHLKTKKTASTSLKKKKSSTVKRRTAPRTKKPKVALSKNKVALLSGLISGLSILAIVLSVIVNSGKIESSPKERAKIEKSQEIQQIQKTEKKEAAKKNIEKAPEGKKSESKKESVSQIQKNTSSEKKLSVKNQEKNISQKALSKTVQNQSTQSQTTQIPKNQIQKANQTIKKDYASSSNEKIAKIEKKSASQIASAKSSYESEKIEENIPKNRFAIPPAKNGATIVIIIDDAGASLENAKRYASLPFPITIAVLPKLANSRACAQAIIASGQEAILHQPMQSMNLNLDPGPGKITGEMSTYEIARIVKENLLSLGPGVKGMNNHEGSLITSNVIKIGAVLEVCNEMGVYFLDSRTTAQTQAPQAALERDMHIFEKAGPYLDNEIDRAKMIERMRETLAYANVHGQAIVIGHVDKSVKILPDLLAQMYPEMKAAGYRFATPSMLRK
ncbi:MAG: divergent polysaccharide deacetylase family protein [Treponema sp.]|nr:divergent polysaccharide deacetylase family protein [Treponema sp.]